MMKKLCSLFVALVATLSLWAQNTLYSESFATSQGAFTVYDVNLDNLSYVWIFSSQYGMKASAYVGSVNHTTESWLISPNLDIPAGATTQLTFDHTYRYTTTPTTDLTLFVSTNYAGGAPSSATWTPITIPTYSSGTNWTFVNAGTINISSYAGRRIAFAFRYKSSATAAATWEIKNVRVETDNSTDTPNITNHEIKYTADEKLSETTSGTSYGSLHTDAFNVPITSHTFSNGTGTITFSGDVTSIGEGAFYYCYSLTSITIPNSVTSIGDYAFFYCSGLTSVTIPNSVTSIGSRAFSGCSGLTSITIPNSVTSIGASAFSICSGLTSITIPNSVTSIGDHAFSYCSGLTSVIFGNSVTSIGNYAFIDCSSLTSVTIPNSVMSIGNGAFQYCSGLTSVTIGNSVTSIGEAAFYDCSGLTSVTIGNSVTSIGEAAFEGCSGLTSVTIPNSVTSIGDIAFADCENLTKITVEDGNEFYDSRNNCNAIIETSNNTLVVGCRNTIIPNSVTSIGEYAFYYCSSLTSITIPNSVTSVGARAFAGCENLTKITVEDGNEFYDSRNNCNAIIETSNNTLVVGCRNTIIPNGVTSIGDYAFRGCSGLTSITIPNSVTSIGGSAFRGCSGLTSITIPNSVTSIGNWVFYDCSGLTSVTIGNSVTSIGASAFRGCSGLTSITIPNSVTSIGEYAFRDCSGLTSVIIGNSVTSIGGSAFYGCENLRTVYNGSSLNITQGSTDHGYVAYYANKVYNGIVDGDFLWNGTIIVAYLGSSTSIIIPNKATSIGCGVFSGCYDVSDIYCGATVPPTCEDGDETFKSMGQFTTTVHVPAGSVDMYKAALGWRYLFNIIGDYESQTALENTSSTHDNLQKIYHNGQIYIIRNGEKYTLTGCKVE